MPPADDMPASDLARVLRRRGEHYPVSDAYEAEGLLGDHWWGSQREHVTAWLDELDGPGAYGRTSRGLGARHFWQHFQCAPGLLWVAEALGEDGATVRRAAEEAGREASPASQCTAIRRVIPWERVLALAGMRGASN